MQRNWTKLWISLCLLSVLGCATTSNNAALELPGCDVALAKQALVTAPRKICILPVKIDIGELGAGGSTELVPEWSAEGTKIVENCVSKHVKSSLGIEIVPIPELSEENRIILDQYRALYEAAASNHEYVKTIPAWGHLAGRVTTVGPGMSGLKKQLGADAILFVSGYNFHSSAGRKAAFVVYAALTGAALPMGFCNLHTGLVDVQSGDVLWSFTNHSNLHSLKNEEQVQQMLNQSFTSFPKAGIKEVGHAEAQ